MREKVNLVLSRVVTVFRKMRRAELYFIVFVFCFGVGLRVWAACGPFLYDESHTFVHYAARSLHACLTDLRLANNHIFHTLWVYFFCKLFGYSIWCLRLPSLICGALMLPVMYALARRFFNKRVALICLALVALSPMLIRYSSEGRGYGLQMLLMALSLLSAKTEAINKNKLFLPITGLLCALGMYTLMSHAFAVVGLYLWIACHHLAERKKVRVINALTFFGNVAYVVSLVALFYAPVLYSSGLEMIAGKKGSGSDSFMGQVIWGLRDYAWTLPHYFAEASEINIDRFLLPLFGLFVFFGWRQFRSGWTACMLVVFGSLAALILANTQPFQRNFLFLLPVYFLCIAAAIDMLWSWSKQRYWAWAASALMIALLSAMIYEASVYTYRRYHPLGYNSRTLYRLFLDAANDGDYLALPGNMAGRLSAYFLVNKVSVSTVDYQWNATVLQLHTNPKAENPNPKPQVFTFGVGLPSAFASDFEKKTFLQEDNVILTVFESK